MNTESTFTIGITLADIDACGVIEQCGNISKRVAEIQEMVEIIRQASRKGYPDIVRDHANRIMPRLENIYLAAQVAMIDAKKLCK